MGELLPYAYGLAILGFVVGVALFVRGLIAYRRGAVVSSIATSTADALAAGEVRLTGTVEALAITLVSPLQSRQCVWYHGRITEHEGRSERVVLDETRGMDFALRDATGTVRVVPVHLRAELEPAFDASTDLLGSEPAGLARRSGPASEAVPEFDRQAAIADLLTVKPAPSDGGPESASMLGGMLGGPGAGRRHYTEFRIEPGEQVTVVGFARPYGEIAATRPDQLTTVDPDTIDDPIVAADLAEAQAKGTLAKSAREAWGNAAIPGFGIGRPVEKPVLDPGVNPPQAPDPAVARRAKEVFDVPPETLVVTTDPSRPLTVYAGSPAAATDFDRAAYLRGLAGGALAIASILVLVAAARGGV
jgi:hypothetical protein